MEDREIYAALTEIIRDVLMRDEIVLTPKMSAKDVEGWDSFKMIEIIMMVESQFSIKVGSRQLDRLETVGELVDLIRVGTAKHSQSV
ncbi:MAG: hypothetical protein B7Z78_06170 [Rhodospirillales bacterium 20-60-12]|nr:MAG: hypothetical protein B7Z78_06170 [Rhodospirillales bacterium 20-60-12]HQT68682.1 acyl carrier protein [Acetobacteraceae bacterium]